MDETDSSFPKHESQIFPKAANTIALAGISGTLLMITAIAWASGIANRSPYYTRVDVEIPQPVPFSHEHHVSGLGIDCRYCHTTAEVSPFAGIPPVETCMTCHSQVWKDAPILQPIRESFYTGRPLAWNRVHNLPDFVYFNHSIHVNKGVACRECHGHVDQMPLISKQATLFMQWCLDCHRHPESKRGLQGAVFAPNPPETGKIYAWLEGTSERSQSPIKPLPSTTTRRLTDCTTCHR